VRILHTYILRLHLVPFVLGFGVVTFILEMDVLFDYLDLIVNRGVAVGIVAQLFVLSLGYIIALSVPCAVLVAALMTFGRLSQDNEITALRASGVNLGTILVGPITGSILIAVILTLFNNHVLPEANHSFANLLIDIGRMRPTARLQEGVFITDFPGYSLLVQSVNGRTNRMQGITIYQANAGGPPTTIIARSGYLSYTPDGHTAVLELQDGEIHEVPQDEPGARTYRRLVFKTHVIHIADAGGVLERTVRDVRSDREMSARSLMQERDKVAGELREVLLSKRIEFEREGVPPVAFAAAFTENPAGLHALAFQAVGGDTKLDKLEEQFPTLADRFELVRQEMETGRRRIAGLSVEVHKKFSLPAACVVFVLIGAPIGMRVRRSGPAVAFVSVAFFLFYYLCLIGGEELANRLLLPPWLSMWLPNIVLGVQGIQSTLSACELLPRRRLRQVVRAAA